MKLSPFAKVSCKLRSGFFGPKCSECAMTNRQHQFTRRCSLVACFDDARAK